ncbi:unnamed protein product [Microthlaspi erraticum]|uniref:Reverse transcriptase zinc-binding domain-containing protein n=1 Tax=Microthlaspi erraticum TaxID=1685480 RepID=A0A6D2IKD7_9BRAS|nr:unnamed protein product [Microthlaspi erraticum]
MITRNQQRRLKHLASSPSITRLNPLEIPSSSQLSEPRTEEVMEVLCPRLHGSSVFALPKQFYAKIDSLCAAFLWKKRTESARGARVAWKDVCKPKAEGGLGIRLLEEYEKVFRLKQIWNLFSNSGSLWVAWVKAHVFGRKGFWLTEDSNRISRNIRSMLQLKNDLMDLLRCEIGDGNRGSFWFDYWNDMGQLLLVMGQSGPRNLRIPLNATVSRANKGWEMVDPTCPIN